MQNTTALKACGDCHKGTQIDFVIVMQKTSDKGNPICNAMSGDVPGTVGGSSVATSTSAGIAALVWSGTSNRNKSTNCKPAYNNCQFLSN